MSYHVEIDLPSCCAEHLHLAAELEQCTLEEMVVLACMAGLLNFAQWNLTPTPANAQAICDATSLIFHPVQQKREE